MAWTDIEDAIAAIARGEMVIVVDDENRENEGDIILAAEAATPEKIAFIVRHTSGVICAALPAERLDELDLPLMVAENTESMRTAFTITVDYLHGTTTGISASDRAATLQALVDRNAKAGDFTRPGHIFPIRAVPGGVLERPGHTEAAVDLTRLAGLAPGGVLCEIVNHDGSMARMTDLEKFSREYGLPIITIADLAVQRIKTTQRPTQLDIYSDGNPNLRNRAKSIQRVQPF
ncbi:MAG: 3,4-dihydroxy-2-butanone-4-phosphate synthase [Rhodomicrobiaceae bacterium]